MKSPVINLGDIYYIPLNQQDDITPKGGLDHRYKFCIVVGFSEYGYYVVYFIMNSQPNPNYINTDELLACQFPLNRKDYPDIIQPDKDPSFLDLGHAREIEKTRLIQEGEYKGKLIQSDLQMIMEWLRETDQYSIKQKRKYGWI